MPRPKNKVRRHRAALALLSGLRTRQWLAVPLALPMWLAARSAPTGTIARGLGSFMLLLGRNVVIQGTKVT